jgi:hypothetical protein
MIVWFENVETGQQWCVDDPDMIARLDANKEFKRVEKAKKTTSKKAKAEETSAE